MGKKFHFTLTGVTPLLMHQADVLLTDEVNDARKSPEARNERKGDDRFPTWTWATYLYRADGRVVMPVSNLMPCLRKAGSEIVIPTGRKGKTFKTESQSAIFVHGMPINGVPSPFLKFTCNGEEVQMDWIEAMRGKSFNDQLQVVRKHGFDMLLKWATIGQAKHVRVRPQFNDWKVEGVVEITNEAHMTADTLRDIFEVAGCRVGLGDWRPSAPKAPGSYGIFTSILKAT